MSKHLAIAEPENRAPLVRYLAGILLLGHRTVVLRLAVILSFALAAIAGGLVGHWAGHNLTPVTVQAKIAMKLSDAGERILPETAASVERGFLEDIGAQFPPPGSPGSLRVETLKNPEGRVSIWALNFPAVRAPDLEEFQAVIHETIKGSVGVRIVFEVPDLQDFSVSSPKPANIPFQIVFGALTGAFLLGVLQITIFFSLQVGQKFFSKVRWSPFHLRRPEIRQVSRNFTRRNRTHFLRSVSNWQERFGIALLFLLPFLISVSPRFGLPTGGDLRIQDFLIVAAAIWLLAPEIVDFLKTKKIRKSLTLIIVTPVLLLISAMPTITQFGDWSAQVIGLGMALRFSILVLLFFVTYRLTERHGNRGITASIGGVLCGVCLNLGFLVIQQFKGPIPPWNPANFEPSMYGPGLIGEGAVFNVGGYWFIVFALATVLAITSTRRFVTPIGLLIALASLIAIYQVNSRASVVATFAIIFVILLALFSRDFAWGARILPFLPMLLLAALLFVLGLVVPRSSISNVVPSLEWRWGRFGVPAIEDMTLLEQLFGRGLGGTRAAISAETHNFYLAVFGDFGIIGGLTVLIGLVSLLIWLTWVFSEQATTPVELGLVFLSYTALFFILLGGIAQDSQLPVLPTQLIASIFGISSAFFARIVKG